MQSNFVAETSAGIIPDSDQERMQRDLVARIQRIEEINRIDPSQGDLGKSQIMEMLLWIAFSIVIWIVFLIAS